MYKVGDIIETKKPHVCENNKWQIIRSGADIKIECTKCKRIVLLSSYELDKRVKKTKQV